MAGSKLYARSKLAPVLEDYHTGPAGAADHEDYEIDDVDVRQKKLGAAAPAKGRKPIKGSKKVSRSPLCLLGKLRDAYVRMMNEIADREMSAVGVAGYHGVAAPYTYPCRAAFQYGITEDYNGCDLLKEFFGPECQTRTHEVTKR